MWLLTFVPVRLLPARAVVYDSLRCLLTDMKRAQFDPKLSSSLENGFCNQSIVDSFHFSSHKQPKPAKKISFLGWKLELTASCIWHLCLTFRYVLRCVRETVFLCLWLGYLTGVQDPCFRVVGLVAKDSLTPVEYLILILFCRHHFCINSTYE